MADKKLTPKDYDRWGGIVGIKVTGKPNKNTEKDKITYPKQDKYFQNETTEKFFHNTDEYKRKVELVLQKQRNGEELTDDEEEYWDGIEERLIKKINKMTKPDLQNALYALLMDGPEWQFERFVSEYVEWD